MFSTKVSNFHEVFKPLHICSQLVGLTSFVISTNAGMFEASVKFYNIVILFVGTLLDCVLILFLVTHDDLWGAKQNPFVHSKQVESGIAIIVFIFVLIMSVIAIYEYRKRRYLIKCIELICEVDKSPQISSVNDINYKKQKMFVEISIFMTFLLLTYSYVTNYKIKRTFHMESMTHLYMILISKSVNTYFFIYIHLILFITTIKSRYQRINSYLRNKMLGKACLYTFERELVEVAKLHDKLVDATQYMNQFYGFPVS